MYDALKTKALFSFPDHTLAWDYLAGFEYPWQALYGLKEFILSLGSSLSRDVFDNPKEGVYIAKSARVDKSAYIGAPCIIDEGAEVRHCAYLRGCAVIGKGAVVGNSVEVKNAILFDAVQVPHFNYVGDSILGYQSHLGAGAVTSNVKSDKSEVTILLSGERVRSGRRKLGAMVSDFVEVGCNSVLNPGTVLGQGVRIYPLSSVRGYLPPMHIYKSKTKTVPYRP